MRKAWSVVVLLCLVQASLRVVGAQESARPASSQRVEDRLAAGKALLQQRRLPEAIAEFDAVLQHEPAHPEATRLRTKAQALWKRLRDEAIKVALDLARQKAKERTRHGADAQRQLVKAREQQLKFFYTRGLSFYRQGAYHDAIETLHQMTLLDPAHPLVERAQRLIRQAELKLGEQGIRQRAKLPEGSPGAMISELERQLTEQRIELETTLKYAKQAFRQRDYDLAIELAQKVLAKDARNRPGQELLQQAELAKLKAEDARLNEQVLLDEQRMVNEVRKAQLLPTTEPVGFTPRPAASHLTQAAAAKLQQPISFDFQEVALGDVLQFLADSASVSMIPSPQIDLETRQVSMRVKDLPLELALKYLLKNQELAYRIEEGAILIASPDEFANEPLETRVFFLRSGLGPFALETTAAEPNPVLPMESIKDLIDQAVTKPSGSSVVVDERSGAIIVTNTIENLRLIERLLEQLDTTPIQVLIEARFLEVTLTDLEQVGFEAVLTGDVALNKKGAPTGTRHAEHQIAKSGGFKFPALARETEGLNLTLQGVLTGTQFEAVLHLLAETQRTKTLSAPRVTTLNNQSAMIKVVDEFRYPTRYEVSLIQFDINGDGDFDDAGETEFANVPQDFKQRDIGILLHVTPSVGKDLKTVTLVLAPEVSSFSQFRDLGGGVTVPEFTSSQLTTSVAIQDGQTVVLGGLMKDTVSYQLTKIPFLGDLPLVGGFFRQRDESTTRKNLLIFVTARILAPRGPTT